MKNKVNKAMRVNLDDEKKEYIKKRATKEKQKSVIT